MPTMRIPLGLAVELKPTLGAIWRRAEAQLDLVASGQKTLAYLRDKDSISASRLDTVDGAYILATEIPVSPQSSLVGHRGQIARDRDNALLRNDDNEQEAVDATVAAVQFSSGLVDRVAQIVSTSADMVTELRKIEHLEGIDTRPARRFIYSAQMEFSVEVDDENVVFNAHAVRAAVADQKPVKVELTLAEPKTSSTVVRGLVHTAQGNGIHVGVQSGGNRDFRFAELDGWQKTVLEGAQWLNLVIVLEAVETVSTCTLARGPADVLRVKNWAELLEQTRISLEQIQQALGDVNSANLASQVLS